MMGSPMVLSQQQSQITKKIGLYQWNWYNASMRFFFFFLGVFGGILWVIYHKKIADLIGFKIGWAERYLGAGGTYTAYILFGLIAILMGFLIGFDRITLGFFGI